MAITLNTLTIRCEDKKLSILKNNENNIFLLGNSNSCLPITTTTEKICWFAALFFAAITVVGLIPLTIYASYKGLRIINIDTKDGSRTFFVTDFVKTDISFLFYAKVNSFWPFITFISPFNNP